MLALSSPYLTHLAGEVTELATCWTVTLQNGTVLGFTDHPENIPFGGIIYESAVGYSATDISTSGDLSVDNLNLQGFIDSPSITEADLVAGLWDFAQVEIFEVVYSNLAAGVRRLRRGRIGEVTLGNAVFEAELRGLSQAFTQQVCELTSGLCRARLGDARCGVDLGPLTVTGTLTGVTNARTFTDSTRAEAAGYFTFGTLTMTSGLNDGFKMEVKTHSTGGAFILQLPFPYALAVGDSYSLVPGCDLLPNTCRTKYSNYVNFRGEEYIPGQDALLRGPG